MDGKSGLEVLMLIIENGLNSTSLDENQGILAGPLIADLVQKVSLVQILIFQASGEIQPHLPNLLNIIIRQLSTATKPEFIQVFPSPFR